MRLGVITSLWAYAEGLSVVETLMRIAALGFHYVDILGILHGDPLSLPSEEKRRIGRYLQTSNMSAGSLVLVPPGNIASLEAGERKANWEYVRAGIDFIAGLGGNQVLMNGGKRVFDLPSAQAWESAASFLRLAAEHAATAGVLVTVEAEPYASFLVNDVDSTARMAEHVNHPALRAAIDTGHMNLSREGPWALTRVKPWIARVHLSENHGLVHANNTLGTGTVQTAAYLRALRDMDIETYCSERGVDLRVVLELGVMGEAIDDADSCARASLEHVTQIAPFMRLDGG